MTRTTRSSRWRRSTLLAAAALAAAAMIVPAGAHAAWSSYDPDTGNTEPAGYGSAPDPPPGGGSSTPTITTEIDSTVPIQGSSCRWTVKGHLLVRHPTVPGLSDGDPVVGVKVRVSGRSSLGAALGELGYNSWGTDVTNSAGEFSVSKTECGDRRVKVEAKFESDDLRVLGPDSPTWWQLDDTDDEIAPSTIDLNGEPFGGEGGEQIMRQAQVDAQTWILYRRAIDYVTSLGYPFLNHTTVHNPATLAPNGSWSDPILHEIHIEPASTDSVFAMLHELGHAWAYPREIGEGCLTNAVIADGDTHDFQEKNCVAFNEGFADFFGHKLQLQMHAAGLIASVPYNGATTPLSRAWLVGKGLINNDWAEQNELGWDQAFRVLTAPDITRDLFGPNYGNWGYVHAYTGPSCAGLGVPTGLSDLADALQVIGDENDQFDMQDADKPSFAAFFDRAADRLKGFGPLDSAHYQETVDTAKDVEPHELYMC